MQFSGTILRLYHRQSQKQAAYISSPKQGKAEGQMEFILLKNWARFIFICCLFWLYLLIINFKAIMSKHRDELACIQQYEGHLKRLLKLKQRPLTHIKHSLTNLKSHVREKMMTEQFQIEQSPIRKVRTKTLIPLPSIPQYQKQLINSSLKDKKLPEKQAEIFLKNYLLSRRILNVKSSIKYNHFEKSYKKHQQYSILRSKSRISSINIEESRLKKFKQFQVKSHKEQSSILGSGNYTFSLSIKKLQKIRRQAEEGTLYNIGVRLHKKRFKFSNLSLKQLQQDHKFHFRKKDIEQPYEIIIEIEMILQNQILRYGWFTIDVDEPCCQIKGLSKGQAYFYERKSQIEGVKSIKSDKLIGTVEFDYQIARESRQL